MNLPSPGQTNAFQETHRVSFSISAGLLLILMALLAGGAALRESATIDEVAHVGAGLSYLQKFELRLNEEHPPLPKILAAIPLVLRGTRADYSSTTWTVSREFIPAFMGQFFFGDAVLNQWNKPAPTLAWARLPMLLLTLALGWVVFVYARRLGGDWGGLLCLAVYVSTPTFLVFGPLVHTDIAVTLFTLLTLWTFASLWQEPSRKNVLLFASCFAAALLSKFTAGTLFFVFIAFALCTRWLPVPGQPAAKPDVRAWRRLRWRATWKGVLWAALFVYSFYFIFSIRQTTDVLYLLGHGPAAVPLRRLLMPPWLYLRGMVIILFTLSRPTFLLGHVLPHGTWYFYPVVFALKSPLGFLGLLLLALILAVAWKKRASSSASPEVPESLHLHWRVLWVSLLLFTVLCLTSRLAISIRHFSIPIVLLILLLAPLPRLLARLWQTSPLAGRSLAALTALLAASCLVTVLRAYPYYFPYFNRLGLGRPAYFLASDSNVDWNHALPDVRHFVEQHGLQQIRVDSYGMTDPAEIVPHAQLWNCQRPAVADGGEWVAVSANMILDAHNCSWLMQYPHEALAGGSMYAVHLPMPIPAPGTPGGPPLYSAQREFLTPIAGMDMRFVFVNIARHPEMLPGVAAMMKEQAGAAFRNRGHKPRAQSPTAP